MSAPPPTPSSLGGTGSEEAEHWMAAHFGPGVLPPFSFIYGGTPSEQFIRDWQFIHQRRPPDGPRTEHVFRYTDPETRLQLCCECCLFDDFPAIEWVVKLRNEGSEDTPLLDQIQALDVTFTRKQNGDLVLRRALGSSATRSDFAPVEELLRPNAPVTLAPVGGRSSNTTALPFFDVGSVGEGGVMVGIGWSGQWAASVVRNEDSSWQVRAGMELTHLRLHPGEEIRTPRVLLLGWQGNDHVDGHNLLRRFILAHHMPQNDGKPVALPFACSGSPAYFDPTNKGPEFNDATEENQIAYAQRYHELGLAADYWWIDAGWFEGGWPNGVGNWSIRKDGFPNGLRPVSEAVKKLGMGFLLWFEPERVYQGTWLDREHPEWILRLPGSPRGLLDLGNEEARRWLTDHISGLIEREGINVYRQDFNMDPLPYWRAADPPDRQGMAEIRHVEGLYAFWDELLQRHPGLIIDNCASGGRRIDLETVSRSVVLWRTDYQYFEPNGYQSHTCGISRYLPSTSTGCGSPDPYVFRSSMNNGLTLGWNLYQDDFRVEQARRLVEEFRRVRHLFFGDFYPLTPHRVTDDTWIAYQFHREDLREGMVLAFRRPQSPYVTARLALKGLSPTARCELTFADSGMQHVCSGNELAEGLDVTIESAPGSALITYRQCP